MVIDETLRMYPPVIRWALSDLSGTRSLIVEPRSRFDRVASIDYQLGEYLIPKGSIISVPVYPLHHDPSVWSDPETFIPERYNARESLSELSRTYCLIDFLPRKRPNEIRWHFFPSAMGLGKCAHRSIIVSRFSFPRWNASSIVIVLACGSPSWKRNLPLPKPYLRLKYKDVKRLKSAMLVSVYVLLSIESRIF